MIQDIAPHRFDNAYKPVPPRPEDCILYFENRSCLLRRAEGKIYFPTVAEVARIHENVSKECIYLFSIDETNYYLMLELDFRKLEAPNFEHRTMLVSKEAFRSAEPQYAAFAGFTGLHLYNWYKSRRFCGGCGSKMESDVKERMMRCPRCGNMEFPRICPAAIIAVTDKNRILLSKYAGRTYKRYALLAGYTEIGETMEETVRREVMEEVGLRVKNIRYYKSQPWGLTETLLMGFYCELDGSDEIRLDEEELALAEWFEREEIPVEPMRDSLTNEMIMRFKNEGACVRGCE